MDSIKQIFSFSGKINTKQFATALLVSVVGYLITCWVVGFLLSIVGIPLGVIKIVISLLSVGLLVRVAALVNRAFLSKK